MSSYDAEKDKLIKTIGDVKTGPDERFSVEVRCYQGSKPRVAIVRYVGSGEDETSRSLGRLPLEHAAAVGELLAKVKP